MTEMPPVMGAEDFAFMLEACPGTMIAIGNGDAVGLHDPAYDFKDEAIPYGVRIGRGWSRRRYRPERAPEVGRYPRTKYVHAASAIHPITEQSRRPGT